MAQGNQKTPLEEILQKRGKPEVSTLPVRIIEWLPLKSIIPTPEITHDAG
jgi:hypothetical protein